MSALLCVRDGEHTSVVGSLVCLGLAIDVVEEAVFLGEPAAFAAVVPAESHVVAGSLGDCVESLLFSHVLSGGLREEGPAADGPARTRAMLRLLLAASM